METTKPLTMQEKELVNYCGAGVIEYLKLMPVVEGSERSFQVWVKGKWEHHEILLVTANTKKPRVWVSLDRAERHFREKYHFRGSVILVI